MPIASNRRINNEKNKYFAKNEQAQNNLQFPA